MTHCVFVDSPRRFCSFLLSLLAIGTPACDEASEREFAGFFADRAKQYVGGPRAYAQHIENIHVCEARKAAETADITAFLEKQ